MKFLDVLLAFSLCISLTDLPFETQYLLRAFGADAKMHRPPSLTGGISDHMPIPCHRKSQSTGHCFFEHYKRQNTFGGCSARACLTHSCPARVRDRGASRRGHACMATEQSGSTLSTSAAEQQDGAVKAILFDMVITLPLVVVGLQPPQSDDMGEACIGIEARG